MTIRTTSADVYAFLSRTRQDLAGVSDSALQEALKTADELVKVEAETKKKLRETDLRAATERDGAAGPASSVLVMAYLAVKYPELAQNISPSAVKRDLASQFDQMTQAKVDSSFSVQHELPEAVLAELRRFVTPVETTGLSAAELLGGWSSLDRRVRVDANAVSIESDKAFLVFEVKGGKLAGVTIANKEAAGLGTPRTVQLSKLSPKALEEIAATVASSRQVPAKPEGALAAQNWEREHGDAQRTVDAVQAGLTDESRALRRDLQKQARATTERFAPALDDYFGAITGLRGSARGILALDLCVGKAYRDLRTFPMLEEFKRTYELHKTRPDRGYDPRDQAR